MKTPICDFVRAYKEKQGVRAHMPGHKGALFVGCEDVDITEVFGADELYDAHGVISESEAAASGIFGTAVTKYSCEGSSLSIRAMLYLALLHAKNEGKSTRILAARCSHKALMCACALLDIDIEWIFSDNADDLVSCVITEGQLACRLDSMEEKPCAVYLTSPDYLGHIADIKKMAEVCRKRGVLLLVDNAHGAYLNFLSPSEHPIALGADICCDSAHKTLPVLTGGGYLHISKNAPDICKESAECAMALFASTSPSYLILQSLDLANAYIENGYREALGAFCEKINELRSALISHGYTLVGDEKLKITVDAKKYGYLGTELADMLRTKKIECEFADPDYTVLMLTPENSDGDILRIRTALLGIGRRAEITGRMPRMSIPEKAMTPRKAMMSAFCEIDTKDALGRVLAQPGVSCPPAIPVVVCGEVIDGKTVDVLSYYKIDKCKVIK